MGPGRIVGRVLFALVLAGCASDGATPTPGTGEAGREAARPGPRNGERVGDFLCEAVYRDERGGAFGTRWVHAAHGMPVTVLRIQSVPQCFLHFSTPPDSDRGEPHTGEHLLLGKGARGKMLQAHNAAALVGDTAYTAQTEVVYAWNCAAGTESFLGSVDRYLEAMLLPDYTDEEIRREVMNHGVKRDDATGLLSLEEKGTIYNEMVSSYERRWLSWYDIEERVHGEAHPLSFSSGGEPSAVRTMEPRHIRDFHRSHYHLSAGAGLIAALPDSLDTGDFLRHLSATVARLDALPELAQRQKTLHTIPPSRPQTARGVRRIPYPNANPDEIGAAIVAWPPVDPGTPAQRITEETLLAVLGEGETSTLYGLLLDSSTRRVPVEGSSVSGWVEATDINAYAAFALDGLRGASRDETILAGAAEVIRDEAARVAALAPGSPELAEFNARALSNLAGRRRRLLKAMDSPPLFGHRSSGGFWRDHLRLVDRAGGFDRSVALGAEFRALRAALESGANPWTAAAERLGLLTQAPYVSVSFPSPELLERQRAEREERLAAATAALMERTGSPDPQEALRRYAEEIDAATAELDARDAALPEVPLVADVPLVLDPSLRMEPLGGALRGRLGVFDALNSVETALSLDVNGLPAELHPWLPLLPAALTSTGFVEDGTTVPFDEAARRREREILDLSASWSMDPEAGRHELQILAAGGDLDEARLALRWLERSLFRPALTADNLPRLRDLVIQIARQVRTTLGGREEAWVNNPAGVLRFDDDPLYVAATSHHAALYLLARLEFRLMEPPPPERYAAVMGGLTQVDDPVEWVQRLGRPGASWPGSAFPWAVALTQRLAELSRDLPPEAAKARLLRLHDTLKGDLMLPPAEALAQLDAARRFLLHRDRCRVTMTGSRVSADALRPTLDALAAAMGDAPRLAPPARRGDGVVRRNLRARGVDAPVHHALVHGGGSSAVLILSAGGPGLDDLDAESLVDALAALSFGGAGKHGFFMQTWGAGLAYSNGIGLSAPRGRLRYYAERCPDPAETMKYVVGLARRADALTDVRLSTYAVTNAVSPTRASDSFESRTRAQAEDLEAGITPERVARWRRAILDRREDGSMEARVRARLEPVLGRVLPGLGAPSAEAPSGSFLLIAPPGLVDAWERSLRTWEGEGVRLARIHGSDFWPEGP